MTPTQQELRELDAWIALNVFNWERVLPNDVIGEFDKTGTPPNWGDSGIRYHQVPKYSTDPAAAFEVLKKCSEKCTKEHRGSVSLFNIRTIRWCVTSGCGIQGIDETLELALAKFAQKLFSK